MAVYCACWRHNNPRKLHLYFRWGEHEGHQNKDFVLSNSKTYVQDENTGALTRPPETCPLCQYSCSKVVKGCQDVMTSYHDAMWRHDVVPWRNVTSWRHAVTSHDGRCHDLDRWPMTSTLELDLDTFSLDLHAEIQACISVCLARIVRQTDTHTHRQTMPKLLHPPLKRGVKTRTIKVKCNLKNMLS